MVCSICGQKIKKYYGDRINAQLESSELCFSCLFWTELIKLSDKSVRFNGVHYTIVQEQPSNISEWGWGAEDAGFGGQKFKIKFFDGQEVHTNNLWSQGEIPDRFKIQLRDNAHIIAL